MQAACILYDKGYMLGPQLGKGKYAKVKMAERISDSQVVAAKIIFRHRAAPEFLQTFLPRELSIALSLRHPNIVQVYEIIQTPELVCVVMEYASRGDLLDMVRRHGSLQEHQAGLLFGQVCAGVAYLHRQNICHRDLKCENILLRKDMTVALADFGFSRSLLHPQVLSSTYCGSAAYASPELLRGTPYMPLQNDIWSLGCVLYIMVTGQMPFHHTNTTKMMYRQLKGKVSYQHHETVSLTCRSLIAGMLEPNPSLRFEIQTVQRHPWLQPFARLIGALQGQGIDPNSSQGEGLVFAEETNVATHNMDAYGKNISSFAGNHLARHSMAEDESFVNSSHLGSEDSVDGLVKCGEASLVRTLGEPCVLQSSPKGEGGLVRDSSISDFGTDVSVCSLGNNSSRTSLSCQPPVTSDPSQLDQQVIPTDADPMLVSESSSQPELTDAAAQEADLNSCLSRLVEVKLATSCQLLARAALSEPWGESPVLGPAELGDEGRAELVTGGLATSDKISVTRVSGLSSNRRSSAGGLTPKLNRVTHNGGHSGGRDNGHQPGERQSESPKCKHQIANITESLPCNKHIAGIKESIAWKQLLENMKISSTCNNHLANNTESPARETLPSQVRRSTGFEGLKEQCEGLANNRHGSEVGHGRQSKNNTPPDDMDALISDTDGQKQRGAGAAGVSLSRGQPMGTGARSTTGKISTSQIESRTPLQLAGGSYDRCAVYSIGQTSLVSIDQNCRSVVIGQKSVLSRWHVQDSKPISKISAVRTDQESKSASNQAGQVVIGQTEQTSEFGIGQDCRSVVIGQKSVLSRWHVRDSKPISRISVIRTDHDSKSASGQAGQVVIGQTDQTSVVSRGQDCRSVVNGQKSVVSRWHDKDSKPISRISAVKTGQDSRSASGEAGQVSTKSSPGSSSPKGQAGKMTNVIHQRHPRSGSEGLAPASDHSSGSGSVSAAAASHDNYPVMVGATVGQVQHTNPGLDAVSTSGRVAQMRQAFELGNQSGSHRVSTPPGQLRDRSS